MSGKDGIGRGASVSGKHRNLTPKGGVSKDLRFGVPEGQRTLQQDVKKSEELASVLGKDVGRFLKVRSH
jgi:hypothetical protein